MMISVCTEMLLDRRRSLGTRFGLVSGEEDDFPSMSSGCGFCLRGDERRRSLMVGELSVGCGFLSRTVVLRTVVVCVVRVSSTWLSRLVSSRRGNDSLRVIFPVCLLVVVVVVMLLLFVLVVRELRRSVSVFVVCGFLVSGRDCTSSGSLSSGCFFLGPTVVPMVVVLLVFSTTVLPLQSIIFSVTKCGLSGLSAGSLRVGEGDFEVDLRPCGDGDFEGRFVMTIVVSSLTVTVSTSSLGCPRGANSSLGCLPVAGRG